MSWFREEKRLGFGNMEWPQESAYICRKHVPSRGKIMDVGTHMVPSQVVKDQSSLGKGLAKLSEGLKVFISVGGGLAVEGFENQVNKIS